MIKKDSLLRPFFDESGSSSIEMAILTPIFLILVAFWTDRQIIHEGAYSIQVAANQAIRTAAIQETEKDAKKVAKEILSDQFKQTGMGWCENSDTNSCKHWGEVADIGDNTKRFNRVKTEKAAMSTSKGWCNGSYITLGVRAHKGSLLPSYSSLRKLLKNGGAVYHEHTFMVKARVETNKTCN